MIAKLGRLRSADGYASCIYAVFGIQRSDSDKPPQPGLDRVFDRTVASRLIHECVCSVESYSGDFAWSGSYGGKGLDSPLLLASTTKLFTTACVIKLLEEGRLCLEGKVADYVGCDIMDGIHVLNGIDYSLRITVADLLFQRSGLPDWYLDGGDPGAKRVLSEDFSFSLDHVLQLTKELRPKFPPGSPRAYYADVNFDLLGRVAEELTGLPLRHVYDNKIIHPLGLTNTYLAKDPTDDVPPVYNRDELIRRDSFVRSCGASGGVITTARDLMAFIKSFWSGDLFDVKILDTLTAFARLQMSFYPICYAGGYMRIDAGMPLMAKVRLLGHSGSTGSFAFHLPERGLFLVGDVNQIARPSLPVRLAIRLAMAA